MRSRVLLIVVASLLALVAAAPAAAKGPRITFFLGLERPEREARAAFYAVQAPSSPTYRQFSSADELANRFGATPATVKKLRKIVRAAGLGFALDGSRIFARVSGPRPRLERFLGAPIRAQFNNNDNAMLYFTAPGHSLRLPAPVKPLVREVVAAYNRSSKSQASARAAAAKAPQPGNAGTWIDGCTAAQKTGAYSFAQVRHAYGLDAVGTGAGGSVAILNAGEGLSGNDIAVNAKCFGLPELQTRTLTADGQAGPFPRGSFEPQEDLALVRGMAPGLASLTFTQTWEGPELWFLAAAGLLDAPGPLPDSFSISYGICEKEVRGARAPRASKAGAALMDSLLARLGLAGVASFASAGDFGSTCNGRPFPGAAWPATSPFLTAVGGTRLVLTPANERADEVVWNDLAWLSSEEGGGAGGGGRSALSARPPFQASLAVGGSTRAVPDLSAHASMLPGWPVVTAGNWIEDAGTSASAPLLAAGFATLSARLRAAGQPPLGPVNGLLYALAASGPAPVFDVVSGDNGYLPKVPAQQAGPGYDLASGLGVPRFDQLAGTLGPAGG